MYRFRCSFSTTNRCESRQTNIPDETTACFLLIGADKVRKAIHQYRVSNAAYFSISMCGKDFGLQSKSKSKIYLYNRLPHNNTVTHLR